MLGRKIFIAQTDRRTTPLPLKFQENCRNKTQKPFCAPIVSIRNIEQNYWSFRYEWNSWQTACSPHIFAESGISLKIYTEDNSCEIDEVQQYWNGQK